MIQLIQVIKNIQVFAPENLGKKDIIISGTKIYKIQDEIKIDSNLDISIIDGSGMYLFPGFIDPHVHITGGGGEGGFSSRTPEIMLSEITTGGVTTVIGTLGTDGTTRTMTNLLAKARGLEEEGITCFIQTGSYQIPVKTLTGSITDDLVLIDKVIGVGEIAIADHRSSHPDAAELARIVSQARLGGMLAGKAGTVNFHMGDSKRCLDLIEEVLENTDIPKRHFIPTHMNRNPYLFEKAMEYSANGGFIDITTSTVPLFIEEGEIPAFHTLKCMIDKGVTTERVTFSSDGQGSLPLFNDKGEMIGIDVGRVVSLYEAVKNAILLDQIEIEQAIAVITSNTAKVYNLSDKGHIKEGYDADLVIVNSKTLDIDMVFAKGRRMVQDGIAVVKGTYER